MKIYGIVGWKNAGKTGLMERLVREITSRGITVSTLKHAHHHFDVDHKGKDSFRHRAAGAQEVLLSSSKRWALMAELHDQTEPSLEKHLSRLADVDLVLIEGYKRDLHPKVEAFRAETDNPLIAKNDTSIRAVAADQALPDLDIPVFDLNDTNSVADFILKETGLMGRASKQDNKALKNDCFALPQGVSWTPVEQALAHLEENLCCVTDAENMPVSEALDRVLSQNHIANRAHPPLANSAVDGYGFCHGDLKAGGDHVLPLAAGRSAAGAAYEGTLPPGQAVRILTGAALPKGVDTVVLQEDVTVSDGAAVFSGHIKHGANTRKAGEDIEKGQMALKEGTKLGPQDIAYLIACGIDEVAVQKPLRVGILSTGDEIVDISEPAQNGMVYDVNRPMLASVIKKWGYIPVDLGHVADDREALRGRLNDGAKTVDVILTSGGASAGDEDHVSALLNEVGAMQEWRIAIKPGRPLALGLWDGVPVFGLPGNPVAAFVCTLIFGRPAFAKLSGQGWAQTQGFAVPAGFEKQKKAGRREYLRAKIGADGRVQVFASEGSGRVSGLSWAEGLVELSQDAQHIQKGDMVTFLPYGSFDL